MTSTIPGILQETGDQVIHDLILSGHGVDIDLNQVSIDVVNNLSYAGQQVVFAVNALLLGKDGSQPEYMNSTSVVYNRFVADNYFSEFVWQIQLDPPYTVGRVRAALLAQTSIQWDSGDFSEADSYVLAVNSNGQTNIPASQQSKRLFLQVPNSRMSIVITPTALQNLGRVFPPAVIQPPENYFSVTDPRTNIALRLPDANGVMSGPEIKSLVAGQVFNTDLGATAVEWMSNIYGCADGYGVQWFQTATPANNNLFGATVIYNGPLTSDYPAPYNANLDTILVVALDPTHCLNYFGNALVFYNLSRDDGAS